MEWLVAGAGVVMVVWQILQDRRTYPRFKAMTETRDRQGMYRFWVIDNFIRYGVLGVIGLFLIARQDALLAMPADIAAARDAFAAQLGMSAEDVVQIGSMLTLALGAGVLIGGIAPFLVKPRSTEAAVVGDIAALLPRNGAEIRWGAALSINAGVSEEIFFRLAIPLALYAIHPDLLFAFGGAALLFGVVHAYQGVVGIVMTFIVGAVITVLYLASGQIWLVVALHALIDLRAMVLTPLALRRAAS